MLLDLQLPSLPSSEPQTIEEEIGCAMRGAVGALACGILSYMAAGKLSPAARARSAQALAELYELRRDNPCVDDFEDVCRVYGKAALREYLATLPDPAKAPEAKLDQLIGFVLDLLAQVTARRVH
jgi:hypothetical protein